MQKYRAQRTEVDGILFASKREAQRYGVLKLMQAAQEIRSLELQPSYSIVIKDKTVCKVNLDFRYINCKTGKEVIEDSKGFDNPLSSLKRKLVNAQYGIEVILV
jgi:hypothetical protein